MARPRSRKVAIGFMVVWLVVWMGGMMVVLYGLGSAAFGGEAGGALIMAAWLAAAGFGLYLGVRRLRQLVTLPDAPPRSPGRNHQWDDRIGEAGRPTADGRAEASTREQAPTVRRQPRA